MKMESGAGRKMEGQSKAEKQPEEAPALHLFEERPIGPENYPIGTRYTFTSQKDGQLAAEVQLRKVPEVDYPNLPIGNPVPAYVEVIRVSRTAHGVTVDRLGVQDRNLIATPDNLAKLASGDYDFLTKEAN